MSLSVRYVFYNKRKKMNIGIKMELQDLKNKYVKTKLAKELFSKIKEISGDEQFTLGVIINCETDKNIKRMINLIKKKTPTMKEILLYSIELDKSC